MEEFTREEIIAMEKGLVRQSIVILTDLLQTLEEGNEIEDTRNADYLRIWVNGIYKVASDRHQGEGPLTPMEVPRVSCDISL